MQAHPGIVLMPGPAGRRPQLVAGPDVWQIIRARNEFPEGEEGIVEKLTEIASVTAYEIRTVLDYYADYPEETDAWIRRVDEESERAYDEWKREQMQLSS